MNGWPLTVISPSGVTRKSPGTLEPELELELDEELEDDELDVELELEDDEEEELELDDDDVVVPPHAASSATLLESSRPLKILSAVFCAW